MASSWPLKLLHFLFLGNIHSGFQITAESPSCLVPIGNSGCHSTPAPISIWPLPHSISTGDKVVFVDEASFSFVLDPTTQESKVISSLLARFQKEWETLFQPIQQRLCIPFQPQTMATRLSSLTVTLGSAGDSSTSHNPVEKEAYQLIVEDATRAVLSASSVQGLSHGWSTFKQLVQSNCGWNYIPQVPIFINDRPRYSHRGLLLDTSRHFFPLADILRTLDGMAAAKLNVFHWHLVDADSFPVETVRFPNMTLFGAAHYPSKIYSIQDIRQVIEYARERGIRVIPEFDMPGHTYSWGLGNPGLVVCPNMPDWQNYACQPPSGQLDPTQDKTYQVVEGLLEEMSDYFIASIFHVGGDEVNMHCWESTASIQQFMSERGIPSPTKLVALFQERIAVKLQELKKTMMVWQESVLEYNSSLSLESTIVQVWKGSDYTKAVASKGYSMVVSPYNVWYLDCGKGGWITGGQSWCDPFKTWVDMYKYEPSSGLDDKEAELVLGGEVAQWGEVVNPSTLDGSLWPRAAAAAEVLWSPKGTNKNPDAARVRLFHFVSQLEKMGIGYTPFQPQWCEQNPASCRLI